MARNVPSAAVKGRVPSVDDVTQQVMTWIGLSMRLSEARPMTESLGLLNELGLTMPQLVALHVIAFGGPTTMTRLIERVCLSTSAVSALLHRLVEMGLCERQDDPVDRRQHRVQVTAAGQDVVRRLLQSRMKDTRASIVPLSAATRGLLSRVLGVVNQELGVLARVSHTSRCAGASADVDPIFDQLLTQKKPPSAHRMPVTAAARPASKSRTAAKTSSTRPVKPAAASVSRAAKPKRSPNQEKT